MIMASPQEQKDARNILQGKNLMPYLNSSDKNGVVRQYHKLSHIRRANGKKPNPIINYY